MSSYKHEYTKRVFNIWNFILTSHLVIEKKRGLNKEIIFLYFLINCNFKF